MLGDLITNAHKLLNSLVTGYKFRKLSGDCLAKYSGLKDCRASWPLFSYAGLREVINSPFSLTRCLVGLLCLFLWSCGEGVIQNAPDPAGQLSPTNESNGSLEGNPIYLSTSLDTDSDGVFNAYDAAYLDAARVVLGTGAPLDPYIISNIYQLQAIAGVDHTGVALDNSEFTGRSWLFGANKLEQLAAAYLINQDIDASETAQWRSAMVNASRSDTGFNPIGECDSISECPTGAGAVFSGRLSGAGHTISNLYINHAALGDIGLFKSINASGLVSLVRLEDARIRGLTNVGGIAGTNHGTLVGVDVEGQLWGDTGVGLLVGANRGKISTATGSGDLQGGLYVGGIAGLSYDRVEHSYSTAVIRGDRIVGGLIGSNFGEIFDSYSFSSLSGNSNLGGLIGINFDGGVVTDSYSGGTVAGVVNVGGFVGTNQANGSISSTSSTAVVNGSRAVGGLAGNNEGVVFNSHADSRVRGDYAVGGLVGNNSRNIKGSYFIGSVAGRETVGGLVGIGSGTLDLTFAQAAVRGTDKVGGLVGEWRGSAGIESSISLSELEVEMGGLSGGLVAAYAPEFFTESYWLHPTDSPAPGAGLSPGRGVSAEQLSQCSLSVDHRAGEALADCQDLFSEEMWQNTISRDNRSLGWDFSDPEAPPSLVTRRGEPRLTQCNLRSSGTCRAHVHLSQGHAGLRLMRLTTQHNAPRAAAGHSYEFARVQPAAAVALFRISANGYISFTRAPRLEDLGRYRITVNVLIPRGNSQLPPRRQLSDKTIIISILAD